MAAVLDTHAAIWYVFTPSDLSQAAIQFVRGAAKNRKCIKGQLWVCQSGLAPFAHLIWPPLTCSS
jgi:hypothetical protein